MEILEAALRKMPKVFSSEEFINEAKRHGFTKRQVANGVSFRFLLNNADRSPESIRMWSKRPTERMKMPERETNYIQTASTPISDIDAAISLLKKNGYRVMKRVEEWAEI